MCISFTLLQIYNIIYIYTNVIFVLLSFFDCCRLYLVPIMEDYYQKGNDVNFMRSRAYLSSECGGVEVGELSLVALFLPASISAE